jgi:hypothetical protein
MRWLSLVVLGACSFTPGVLPGDGAGSDARGVDSSLQSDATETDGMPDGPPAATGPFVRLIDIVDAKVAGGPHVDFPLLVSITAPWLKSKANSGDVVRTDGFDVYFSADQLGATRLAFEVETYSPTAGTLIAWVKIPSLVAQTTLYLHYGDPAITTSQAMVTATWSGGYELVAHMATSSDATNNASAISATTGAAVTGQIGSALTFNGAGDRISYGSDSELDNVFGGGGAIEIGANPTSFGQSDLGRLLSKEDSNGWFLSVDDSNVNDSLGFQHGGASGSKGSWMGQNNNIPLNLWTHIALVYNKDSSSNNAAIYINGTSVTPQELDSPSGPLDSDASSTLVVGNRTSADRSFAGLLDEVRVSSVSRSGDWLGTQYRNQSDPSTFYTVGTPL